MKTGQDVRPLTLHEDLSQVPHCALVSLHTGNAEACKIIGRFCDVLAMGGLAAHFAAASSGRTSDAVGPRK